MKEGWEGVNKRLYFLGLTGGNTTITCLSMTRKVPKAGIIISGKLWKHSIYILMPGKVWKSVLFFVALDRHMI